MMMRSRGRAERTGARTRTDQGHHEIATQMQSEAMEIMSGLQDLTPEERQAEMANVMQMVTDRAKELQKKVDEILDDKQTARVKELSFSSGASTALGDEEVDHRAEAHRRAEAATGQDSRSSAAKNAGNRAGSAVAAGAIATKSAKRFKPCARRWAIKPLQSSRPNRSSSRR